MDSRSSILFVTVGGSHQPILTAIRSLAPQRVVFFCTEAAPGQAGSRVQVEGKGMCIKARPQDDKPTLPNIPTQSGLAPDGWELVTVPGDDLDGACLEMSRAIDRAAAAHPAAGLVADYTGGTKTMTAALVLAALDHGGVELTFVPGARPDLVKVRDGTQMLAPASTDALRLRREMAPFLAAWQRHAYDDAARGLASLRVPARPDLRSSLIQAIAFSRALAAWDLFDHAVALDLLEPYAALAASALGLRWTALRNLARPEGLDPRAEALRIWDLWLNARRRAAAGRYDDAVARVYRLLEWAAQWVLKTRRGWNTGELPAEVAQAAGIEADTEGRYQAGLLAAWKLAAVHAGDEIGTFYAEEGRAMLDHIRRRNDSILAHGHTPVSAQDWHAFLAWLERAFEPLLRSLLASAKIHQPFPQLPARYPG